MRRKRRARGQGSHARDFTGWSRAPPVSNLYAESDSGLGGGVAVVSRKGRRARLVQFVRAYIRRALILFLPKPSPVEATLAYLKHYEHEILFGLRVPYLLFDRRPIPRTRVAWRELLIPESRA